MGVGECSDTRCDFRFICSCQSVQNLGLAVITMVAGVIVDHEGYFMLELFFIGWLLGKNLL